MRGIGHTTAFLVCINFLVACNTDPLWEPRQTIDAATMPIDAPYGMDLPDIKITDAKEVDLVEQLLFHRAMYYRSLGALHDYYVSRGYDNKSRLAAHELKDARRIRPFRYIMSGEIPSASLSPIESIAEADTAYDEAVAMLKGGGHGLPFIYRESKLREALASFRGLIETYPSSDKIDDAAFYCGEIHKEYFDENRLAVRWYERAFTWNPQTPHPARFQAAVVYDYRLYDRARALELYHDVIANETQDQSNVNFSVRRIGQLTSEMQPDVTHVAPTAEAPVSDTLADDG
jgi:hypothetical protein